VPTLEEYLDKVEANQQSLLLEIKRPELYPGIEQQVLTTLGEKGWLSPDHVESKLFIASFSVDTVKTVHDLEPRVKTGFIGKPTNAKLIQYAKFVDQIFPKNTQVTEDYVETVHSLEGAHGKPLELYTWTVNDGPTAMKLADMGVDGIVSDDPDLVSKAVQEGTGPKEGEGDEGSEGE
jgi:glycerophosphoryl diester phosphodiesterase